MPTGHPNNGYDGYIEGLRALGHEVPPAFNMRSYHDMPRDGYDFFLQFDCCDTLSNPPVNYMTVYWAYDNWQNYTNERQPDYRGNGHFCRQEYYLPRGQMADLLFSMSLLGVENYAAHGIPSCFMPIGADERLERRPGIMEKKYSVVSICNFWHMGHLNNRRGELVSAIQTVTPPDGPHGPSILSNQVDYFEQADLYAQAKIGWNYSPCGFDVLNFRTFEIMIAGTCQLINERAVPTLQTIGFEPGTDFVSYADDESDLLQKVQDLLAHDEERERIARNGYEKTKASHTMRHRMQMVCEMVERRLNA